MVGGGIDLAALDATKELVQVIVAALASVEAGGLVADEIAAGAHVLSLRVVGHGARMVGRGGVLLVVIASLTIGLPVGSVISTTHMAIVIIEA